MVSSLQVVADHFTTSYLGWGVRWQRKLVEIQRQSYEAWLKGSPARGQLPRPTPRS